jgi:hypothetical protein
MWRFDPAKLHGVAGLRLIGMRQRCHLFGGQRRRERVRRQRKQIFHAHFERARQAQGDRGVRHVAAGFDGVNRLAAKACALCNSTAGRPRFWVRRQVVYNILHARLQSLLRYNASTRNAKLLPSVL